MSRNCCHWFHLDFVYEKTVPPLRNDLSHGNLLSDMNCEGHGRYCKLHAWWANMIGEISRLYLSEETYDAVIRRCGWKKSPKNEPVQKRAGRMGGLVVRVPNWWAGSSSLLRYAWDWEDVSPNFTVQSFRRLHG